MEIDERNISQKMSYSYLFFTFLKIGCTAFGGFMSLIGVINDELVEKDKVLENKLLLDLISLASLLPGPVAVNVVAAVGYHLKGALGALVAMTAIIIPSFFLIVLLAYLYFADFQLIDIDKLFKGILPAVAAIIIATSYAMAKKSIQNYKQVIIGVISLVVIFVSDNYLITIFIILVTGIIGIILFNKKQTKVDTEKVLWNLSSIKSVFNKELFLLCALFVFLLIVSDMATLFITEESLFVLLFNVFSKMSVSLFGGGYVFIPAIQQVVVNELQWLTNLEFVDGIALGQITPGPILITATFIGYKVYGIQGAFISTLAIFLPPAVLMVICVNFLKQIINSNVIQSAFLGIRPAVIGMIIYAGVMLIMGFDFTWQIGAIFIISLLSIIKFEIKAVYIIPLSALIGYIII
jgi:chromate transporter